MGYKFYSLKSAQKLEKTYENCEIIRMSCVFFSNFTCLLLRQSASFGSSFLWILAAVNLHIQHTTQQHSTVSYTVSLYKLYWSNENHHTNMETVNQFCQFDFTIS